MVVTTVTRDEVFQMYATAARATAMSSSREPIIVQTMTDTHTITHTYKLSAVSAVQNYESQVSK